MSRLHQKAAERIQSTAELRSRLVPLETRAALDRDGLPRDGARHG